jgi:hypothetical protein
MLNTIHHHSTVHGAHAIRVGAVALALLLAACDNAYAPPPNGKPENWGQQHYLDVQRQREQNENRMNF